MKFLIDKEIDLNKQDLLQTNSYSKALKEVIVNAPPNTSFTIGLFGEWGSGKSSIVKTVDEELSKSGNKKRIKFVIYDAWKYSNDSFRRMFLLKLQEELKFERTSKFESFYTNKMSDVSINRKVDWKYLMITGLLFFVGVLLIYNIPKEQNEMKLTLTLFISFSGILVNILGRAFSDYKVTVQEPMIFAPEQFEECFNEMMPQVFEKASAINKFTRWVNGVNYISGLDKLVIVIDNIDRCPKDKAYEMITNIKSFLSTQKQIIFLIPVDDEALKRHIIREENNETKEAEEFLRKFFSVTIRIKPFQRFDLYDFTNKINIDNKLGYNPTTIDIISKEFATNPRRIIQFFNDFMSELKIFELKQNVEFIKIHESLICKMLILRQEWPEYYKLISKNSSLINDNESIQDFLSKTPQLSTFLTITDSITRNASYSNIETVLSTYDRASRLSTEIIALIDKKDIDLIVAFIDEKKVELGLLLDYLIERMSKGIQRKTYKTEVNNLFELICFLDSKYNFEKSQNERILGEIRSNIGDFYIYISNLDLLVSYGHSLKKQELSYINELIFNFLNKSISGNSVEPINSFTINLFRSYIRNKDSRIKLRDIKQLGLFEIEFHSTSNRLSEYQLNSEQLSELVSDNILSTIIDRVEDIDTEDPDYSELIYASKNVKFSNATFEEAITKLLGLIPDLTNFTKAELVAIIQDVNEFMIFQKDVVSTDSEKEVLKTFKDKLLSPRNVSGVVTNILMESLSAEELNILSHFFKCIYKVSVGSVSILDNLTSFISASPIDGQVVINARLIELKNEKRNYHFSPISSIILNDETYAKESLELINYILINKDDKNEYRIKEDLALNKIEKVILKYISTNDENIGLFLENISQDIRAKSLLTSIIIKKSKDDILSLPKTIQELSFEMIGDGDKIFEYENNIEYLKAVAAKGDVALISKVVKVIVNKLTRQDSIKEGIEILNEVRELRGNDKKIIEGVIEGMEESVDKEEAKKIINNL